MASKRAEESGWTKWARSLPPLCLSMVLMFTAACSNVRNDAFTGSNTEQILKDVANSNLTDDEKKAVLGATMRAALSGYSLTGKSVETVIDEQNKYVAEEAAREAAAQEAQRKEEQRKEAIAQQIRGSITVYAISKGFANSNYDPEQGDIHGAQQTLRIEMHNIGKKSIKALKGYLVFANQFGDVKYRSAFDYEHPLPVGALVDWDGSIDYNQFEERDQWLRSTPLSQMKFRFEPGSILYGDGTVVTADDSHN